MSILHSNTEGLPESYQEYVETIYRLILKRTNINDKSVSNLAISKALQIKPSSVTNMLRKLEEHKLIIWKPRSKNIELTEKGYSIGKQLIYNHLLFEIFLKNLLGIMDHNLIHKYACELEHHMNEPISDAFTRIFGSATIKKIQEYIDSEQDLDKLKMSGVLDFKFSITPEAILSDFVEKAIKNNESMKDALIKQKEKYLKEFK